MKSKNSNKKISYLKLYYKWLEDGRIPGPGLCLTFEDNNRLLELVSPKSDIDGGSYWGYEGELINLSDYLDRNGLNPYSPMGRDFQYRLRYEFTPMRQNLVLLMAALNGEL